ncbi:MAG TPA: hypothetical protein VJR89_30700 [Polyangiales bacterium]|nr:hypothetical protein [Polyangiales bacterium]
MKWRVLGLGLWWMGCAGTETGNPSFDGTLGYDAYSSQPAQVALQAAQSDAAVVVDAAWLVLGDVRFDGPSGCAETVTAHVDVPGLGAGDHAGTQAPASHAEFTSGRYCRVHLPLQPPAQPPAGAPAQLAGHSMLITGKQRGEAFRIASALTTPVTLQASDAAGFELDDAQAGVLLGFDVSVWLEDLRWADAPRDESGTRVIDANAPELLRAFEAHVAEGVKLFRDRDGDGLLDVERQELAHAAK